LEIFADKESIMKRKLMIIVIIGLILILSSCTLWNMIMGTHIAAAAMGAFLSVNSDGHFLADIVYDLGDQSISYSSAGIYESLTYDYSSALAAFILISGYRATYTWDSTTLLLVKTYSAEYNNSTESWDPLTRTVSYSTFFTDQIHGDAYKLTEETEETWQYDYSVEYDDGSTSVIYKKWVEGDSTLTYFYRRINKNAAGLTTSGWDEERIYQIVEMYPAGVDWSAGNSVTFNTNRTSYRTRSWDTSNNTWGTWSTYDNAVVLIPVSHAGTFMYDTVIDSTKTIEFEEEYYENN